jgi:hypothetical protein
MQAVEDKAVLSVDGEKPFYKNKNLLRLYLQMIPGTLIVSATMGYDGSMMNGIQAVDRWNICEWSIPLAKSTIETLADLA